MATSHLEPGVLQYEELKSDISVRVRSSYKTYREMRARPEEGQGYLAREEKGGSREHCALKVSDVETESDVKSKNHIYCI